MGRSRGEVRLMTGAARANARFVIDLALEQGSAASCFANWPGQDFVGLLELLRSASDTHENTRGARP